MILERRLKRITLNLLLLLFSLVIGYPSTTNAQSKPVRFDRFYTRDGLSQNKIFDIVQDTLGFIWIGTEDGLNRYDGYEFKIYKNDPNDIRSLSSNNIETLHITKSGDLWLGGNLGGLSKFDFNTETFTNYRHDHSDISTIIGNNIRDISEDGKGNLWIATFDQGFDYLDVDSNTFYHMTNILPAGYELNSNFLPFIHQDKNGYLWIGGDGKVHVFNVEYNDNGVPKLQPRKVENQNFKNFPTAIHEDIQGNIWIGTAAEGLFKYEKSNNSLEYVTIKDLSRITDNLIIVDIVTDSENNIWIGGFYTENNLEPVFLRGHELISINLKSGDYNSYRHDPQDESSISSTDILSLFIDKTDVLWIGTFLSGVNKYDKSSIKFNLFTADPNRPDGLPFDAFRGFYEDGNILWIASATNGLIQYNTKNDSYSFYKHDPRNNSTISTDDLMNIYDDGDNLWIGTRGGLNKFDRNSDKFQRFYLDPEDPSSFINGIHYNIIEIDKLPGVLWYGSNGGGLVKFDKKTSTFRNFIYDPETENSLNNRDNFVRTVWYSDSFPNEIWAGTTHGINIFNYKSETFRYYEHDPLDSTSLSHQNIMQFYEDDEGYMWVSTYGGGLNRFDPNTEKFLRFTEENSNLPNNAVYGVLPDGEGFLWMTTNNGVSKFNPKTFEFRNFTVNDGLQSEEFNGGALHKGRSGKMYFGGINGFNTFMPSEVVDNALLPEIVITDLKIFNESLPIGEDSPLKRHISNTDEITLSHWQNDLSFEFVALHYANPAKNKYAFKLENYEDEWRYVDDIRIATYTNLDPGKYIFKVKGSNNDGLWNEEGKSINLIISPPWWRTNLAYLSYLILFGLLIFTFDRIQRRRVIKKEKEKAQIALLEAENERKSKELEEARELQLSMLPKDLPKLPHLDIAVYMQTATEVGGDYYDFHIGMDGTLTVVLGDATGHGMKAGTMVTTTKSLFNVLAPNPNIVDTFHEMTRCLKNMHLEKLSMCMTMLKIAGDKIKMSAAGMPPLLIYKRESQSLEEHVMKGMPLGTFNNFPYTLVEGNIESGDTILMMSDGFPELFNDQKEMYGYKRAKNLFEEVAGLSPEEIISKLKSAGSDWVNDKEPDDDVTFVVIKVK